MESSQCECASSSIRSAAYWKMISAVLLISCASFTSASTSGSTRVPIDRKAIVRTFNIRLSTSHPYSPLHLGNGNFAFGADITGLQTFVPHNTLSSWGWHNSSLPTTPNQTRVEDFTGEDWWTHGRLVNYAQPNPQEKDISQWLISNPHRINLGRIGLRFGEKSRNITENLLSGNRQELDLWTGSAQSEFYLNATKVEVQTVVHPESDTVAVQIESDLIKNADLGVFFDFPAASAKNKFDAPFVGVWDASGKHTTVLDREVERRARITHVLDATTYSVDIAWSGPTAEISRVSNTSHRYILRPTAGAGNRTRLSFTATFVQSERKPFSATQSLTFPAVKHAAANWWSTYWSSGAFVSLPIHTNTSAHALQRRIILSQYLLAVNYAGHDPPQESGLVNNGWYGKFHLEMVFWHMAHWELWNHTSLLARSIPGVYERFLGSSLERARIQGYRGARWGKMSDPSGRSAPGEINSLLVWQQPHILWFAETEYRRAPNNATLRKWDTLVEKTADFMASYAFWNQSTARYDLGPPMYPVSENTNPNATMNPTFELAYWRFGLDVARKWKLRQGKGVPEEWTAVYNNLAPLPTENGVYVTYEGIQDMWITPSFSEDHPGLLGIYGMLPPDSDPARFNITTFTSTVDMVNRHWNFSYSYGWDFPLLAMTAARLGDAENAVRWLLDENFVFDELGMPVGGARVSTPYFPASAGLLLAVGMMAGGWDGDGGGGGGEGVGDGRNGSGGTEREMRVWPTGWDVKVEGFVRAM